jgi:hypothetical protein
MKKIALTPNPFSVITIELTVLVSALLYNPSLNAQDTNESRSPMPTAQTDTVSQLVRTARDRLFLAAEPNIPSSSPTAPRLSIIERLPLGELPVSHPDSQLIVTGTVSGLTPYIVSSNQAVYTEYHVSVNTSLMNHTDWQGTTLDIVEVGGVAQPPNGVVHKHLTRGFGNEIEVGNQYLWFLKYYKAAQCFRILKLWQIRNGMIYAVSIEDLRRVAANTSAVNGLPINTVMNQLKQAIAAQ